LPSDPKKLENPVHAWDNPHMVTVKADDRRRVQLPDAKPGQVFAYELTPSGTITLSRVVVAEPRTIMFKMVRKGGRLVADTKGLKIDPADIARTVREERDGR
jgi:hypothetical protein